MTILTQLFATFSDKILLLEFIFTYLFFPCLRLRDKNVFISLFYMLANERKTLKLLKWLPKGIYCNELI